MQPVNSNTPGNEGDLLAAHLASEPIDEDSCLAEASFGNKKAAEYSILSDRELVVLFSKKADHEAFRQLVGRYSSPLQFFLKRWFPDAHEREDVLQDVFLKIMRKCSLFDPERGEFKSWVFRVAASYATKKAGLLKRIAAKNALSLEGTEYEDSSDRVFADLIDPKSEDPAEIADRSDQIKKMLRTIQSKTDSKQMEIIVARHIDGLSIPAIAERFGITAKNADNQIHRGLRALRKAIEDGEAAEEIKALLFMRTGRRE